MLELNFCGVITESTNRKDRIRKARRTLRVRANLKKGELPRVAVFRSLSHIYGQVIDDQKHQTVVSSSSLQLKNLEGDKKAVARAVGMELAKRAKEKGIEQVIFDRGPYLFHGRVKAFAEGLREGGVRI
jgi:large subunit ribosomal protein L18